MTVLQTLVSFFNLKSPLVAVGRTGGEMTNTSTHLMSPYYTEGRLNNNLMYTMDHTFGYCSHKFLHACVKSSAHSHGTEIRGRNRTETFHQTWVTVGDTVCYVNGVEVQK